jgi:hypothetical protein
MDEDESGPPQPMIAAVTAAKANRRKTQLLTKTPNTTECETNDDRTTHTRALRSRH